MSIARPPVEKYLALDVDGTMIGTQKLTASMLTQQVVDYAKQNGPFAGFYICTKRSVAYFYENIVQYLILGHAANLNTSNPVTVIDAQGNRFIVDRQFFSVCFLLNLARTFEAETGIPFVEISTPDDIYYEHLEPAQRCGQGYTEHHREIERQVVAGIPEDEDCWQLRETEHPFAAPIFFHENKDVQLRQVAAHAKAKGAQKVEIHFIDDKQDENVVPALKALNGMDGVEMRAFHFDQNEVIEIKLISRTPALQSSSRSQAALFQPNMLNLGLQIENGRSHSVLCHTFSELQREWTFIRGSITNSEYESPITITVNGTYVGRQLNAQFTTIAEFEVYIARVKAAEAESELNFEGTTRRGLSYASTRNSFD